MTKEKRELIRHIIKFAISSVASAILTCFLQCNGMLNLNNDFHLAVFTSGATLLGFIITYESVLFACAGIPTVKALWKNNYLDNTCRAAFTEAICCLGMIVTSIFCVLLDQKCPSVMNIFRCLEIFFVFESLFYIAVSIRTLYYVVIALKKDLDSE